MSDEPTPEPKTSRKTQDDDALLDDIVSSVDKFAKRIGIVLIEHAEEPVENS